MTSLERFSFGCVVLLAAVCVALAMNVHQLKDEVKKLHRTSTTVPAIPEPFCDSGVKVWPGAGVFPVKECQLP